MRRYRSQRLAEHVDRWELAGDRSHGDAFRVTGAGQWQNNGVLRQDRLRCRLVQERAGGPLGAVLNVQPFLWCWWRVLLPWPAYRLLQQKAYYSQLIIKLSRENQDSTRAYYVVPVSKIYSPADWRRAKFRRRSLLLRRILAARCSHCRLALRCLPLSETEPAGPMSGTAQTAPRTRTLIGSRHFATYFEAKPPAKNRLILARLQSHGAAIKTCDIFVIPHLPLAACQFANHNGVYALRVLSPNCNCQPSHG